MTKYLFLVIFVATICGCVPVNSGNLVQRTYDGVMVNQVSFDGPWSVEIICNAEENACTILADEAVWEYIDVDYAKSFDAVASSRLTPDQEITVRLTTTGNLKTLLLDNHANLSVSGNNAPMVRMVVEDYSSLSLSGSNSQYYDVEVTNHSSFEWDNSPDRLKISAKNSSYIGGFGSPVVQLKAFGSCVIQMEEVEEIAVRLDAKSVLEVGYIAKSISGLIRGESDITFSGTTSCAVSCFGGSSVIRIK